MTLDSDTFDPEAQEAQRQANALKAQHERNLELDDLHKVMSTKQGRRFMWRLLGRCGVMRQSFNTDALLMSLAEGQRSVGIPLVADLLQCMPEKYALMLEEQKT